MNGLVSCLRLELPLEHLLEQSCYISRVAAKRELICAVKSCTEVANDAFISSSTFIAMACDCIIAVYWLMFCLRFAAYWFVLESWSNSSYLEYTSLK